MVPTSELFSIIRKNNIKLKFVDFPPEVGGYYSCEGTLRIILLNRVLRHNIKAFRSTLARQLGYACTTYNWQERDKKNDFLSIPCVPNNIFSFYARHDDFESLKWAVDFMIPTSDFFYFIQSGKELPLSRISDLFCVTEQFVLLKGYILSSSFLS